MYHPTMKCPLCKAKTTFDMHGHSALNADESFVHRYSVFQHVHAPDKVTRRLCLLLLVLFLF